MAQWAVIFDCDGILVDSERLSAQVMREMAAEAGLAFDAEEALHRIQGRKVATWIAELEDRLGRPLVPEFVPRFRQRCLDLFDRELRAVEGVETVLRGLDLPYCVASSAPRAKIEHTLKHTGLLKYFTGRIHSAYELGVWKPEPGIFLHAAERLGAEPRHCAVVEDSIPGVQAGIRAGMTVFGYARGAAATRLAAEGATTFDAMADLPALLIAWQAGRSPAALKADAGCAGSGTRRTLHAEFP